MAKLTRRSFVKAAGFAGLAASLGGVMTACGNGSSGSSSNSEKKEVIIAISPDSEPAAGFDPAFTWGCGEHMHEPLIQSTLFTTDVNLEFHNDLATDYEMSKDGMKWTFKIRDDVKFTDGKPLTAADVAFTLNTLKNNEGSECDLSSVKKATATDDTTVEVEMEKPYNAFLYLLAVIGIIPEHAYGKDYGSNPIGSGRYMLEQWDKGQQVIFKANPDYYGDAPQMERVVVLFMDEDASMAAAGSGEVDLAYTSATLAANAPKGYSVLACKSVDSRGFALPVIKGGKTIKEDDTAYDAGNDITCNLEVRQAINCGVDRQKFVDNVLNGYGTVAYSVGTDMPWYSEDMVVETDLEQAKKYMTDAGWKLGDDGVFAKDGTRASITAYYNAADSARQAIAEEFKNQMAEIGIEIDARGMAWDDVKMHKYSDLVVWGFGSNAPLEIESLYSSKGSFNVACYENEKVDAYIDQALAAPTLEESFELWKKAQWDGKTGIAPKGDAPWVWLVNIDHLFFNRDGLTVAEQKPHPHGHGWSVMNNVDKWSWQ